MELHVFDARVWVVLMKEVVEGWECGVVGEKEKKRRRRGGRWI